MESRKLRLWLIPAVYAVISFAAGMTLPRFEHAYLATYSMGISAASAQAFFSAVASGMIALTGVIFAVGLVMVQFSAIAYSPRLGSSVGPRSSHFSFSRCLHCYVFLFPRRTIVGRPRRVWERSAVLRLCGCRAAVSQHVAFFSTNEKSNRSADN